MAYGAVATPHLFIFDNQRKLRYVGRFDDSEKAKQQVKSNDAINAVEAILAGKVIYRRLGLIEPLELKKTIVEYVGRYYK